MLKKIIKKNMTTYHLARKFYTCYSYFRNKSILDKNKELKMDDGHHERNPGGL